MSIISSTLLHNQSGPQVTWFHVGVSTNTLYWVLVKHPGTRSHNYAVADKSDTCSHGSAWDRKSVHFFHVLRFP